MKKLSGSLCLLLVGCAGKSLLTSPDTRASATPSTVASPGAPENDACSETECRYPRVSKPSKLKHDDMKHVTGEYCPEVEQVCLRWVDALGEPTAAPTPGKTGRCGEFKNPSVCLTPEGRRPQKDFYIDTYEFPNVAGQVPQSWMTWRDVKSACESRGKRLCTRTEWTLACEGPGMHPYPYGDGYHRDRTSCNTDNSIEGIDVFQAKSPKSPMSARLDNILVPSGSKPGCVSIFGVFYR